MSSAQDFRSLIPQPPGVKIAGPTARAHARARLKDGRARELFDYWSRLYAERYHGLTVDGRVRPDLCERRSERAPIASMADAARQLQNLLSPEQQQLACFPIDAQAFSEPAVDRSKQFARLLRLALVAPEACIVEGCKFLGLDLLSAQLRPQLATAPEAERRPISPALRPSRLSNITALRQASLLSNRRL